MNILAFCKIWKKVIKFINAPIWENWTYQQNRIQYGKK